MFESEKDPSDINRAAGVLQLENGEKRYLSRLKVGEGICKKQDGHGPFLVRFPLMPVRKGSVTDERLAAVISGSEPRSAVIRSLDGGNGHVSRFSGVDEVLGDAALRFLGDVLAWPDDPVRVRYKRLDMSVRLGQRVKEQLVRAGWLESSLIPVGQTRKLVLRVTTTGRKSLGLPDGDHDTRRESVAHAYWKHFYAQRYRQRGYSVQTEAPRIGGQVDVCAENAAERVAIEIETGKSDAAGNVRNGLRSGFARVLVVATDEAALSHIERRLANAGLLIAGRVDVVLRDQDRSNSTPLSP